VPAAAAAAASGLTLAPTRTRTLPTRPGWFWQGAGATQLVTGLFVAASLTDWLDGYLARKMVRRRVSSAPRLPCMREHV
jgi:phosphatidylglycerophosphate synthase